MWLLLVAVVFSVLWYIQRRRRLTLLERNGIPGPKPNLFLGNILEFNAKGSLKSFDEWTKKYGPIVGFYLGGVPYVLVTDLELLKLIQIKDWQNFSDRMEPTKGGLHITDMGQSMMFWQKGKVWKENRNALTPVFNAMKLKQMVPDMETRIESLISDMLKQGDQEFDIYPLYQKMAFLIIASSAFGVNVEPLINDPNHPFKKASKAAVNPQVFSLLPILTMIFPEFTFILYPIRYYYTTLLEYFDMTSEGVLFHFCEKVMGKRRQEKSSTRNDLLQAMLDTQNVVPGEDKSGVAPKGPNPMSDKEIAANSVLMMLAGYETTSTALAYITHHLVNFPDIQEKMRQEVKDLAAKEGKLDYNTVTELSLMEAFISETLRLYPPAMGAVMRRSRDEYQYKDIVIPKETNIFVGVGVLHMDPNLWPEPEKFDPNRFNHQNKAKINIELQTFGVGPRNCIGMRFALLEMKLCLAHLLLKLKFEAGPNTEMGKLSVDNRLFTLIPSKGVSVKISPINAN